jgi:hypothetical protein
MVSDWPSAPRFLDIVDRKNEFKFSRRMVKKKVLQVEGYAESTLSTAKILKGPYPDYMIGASFPTTDPRKRQLPHTANPMSHNSSQTSHGGTLTQG